MVKRIPVRKVRKQGFSYLTLFNIPLSFSASYQDGNINFHAFRIDYHQFPAR
jgi:hypothetical protein